MLKEIKKHLRELDNRQFVDTLFSIGKLHREKLLPEVAEEARLFPFFYHLINDFLDEATTRVTALDPQEMAYMLKGLTNLNDIVKSSEMLEKQE